MATEEQRRFRGPLRGQLLFALVFLVASLLLLSQMGEQTKWVNKTKLFAQPRFWPAVSIGGMVLFGGLHLWKLPIRRFTRADVIEWRIWLFAIEYVLWFLAYVLVVPWLGYLAMTVIFMLILAYRVGYRDRVMLWSAVGVGVAVVVLFKSFLNVKIPGGAIYELLPGTLRTFFILNF